MISPELMRWLTGLRQQVEQTNPEFTALKPVGKPIPFFGDIRTARVLTIGVNPSPSEFSDDRWNGVNDDSQWAHRLLNYFHHHRVPWHTWFRPWESSLRLLGCSYEDRTAAHLDLSPRATTRMSEVPQELRPTFCNMVESDLHWLFDFLAFAPNVRLLLAAGSMMRPEPGAGIPVGAYLVEEALNHDVQIANLGTGHILTCHAGRIALPLYSFRSGPSANDKFKLVNDVFEARENLIRLLR